MFSITKLHWQSSFKKIFNIKFKREKKKTTNKWKNLQRLSFIVYLHYENQTQWTLGTQLDERKYFPCDCVKHTVPRKFQRRVKCMRSDRKLSETPVSRMEMSRHQMWMRADSLVGYANVDVQCEHKALAKYWLASRRT